ncbi:hypothetical protein F4556_005550 [Kitasatospora gansuensis]|uniref:WXG100 family type VII secretion target n=1 Tax=Kitasatospora gansuensis TaxID=258050 RepID=A0A7W7SGG4_9ACTN|nr:hypothetical protein [Kitasatospora gansuensis]MBB4950015.1 hypothetical protein [Kitasatospora gansuensis]
MAANSFSIDVEEVEAAATMIQRMHDDLEEAYIKLSTYVKTVSPDIYGTDLVGKSLGGATASVIGLGKQQENTLAGFKAFLENTAKIAGNLKMMTGGHRETDSEHADKLKKIATDIPLPPAPSAGTGPGYVSPTKGPDLKYNHAGDRPEPKPAPTYGRPQVM